MSRNNSNKELVGLYKRCLSVMNLQYKISLPGADTLRRISKQVVKEAAKMDFKSEYEKSKWIEKRTKELCSNAWVHCFRDPNAVAKTQIGKKLR